MPGEILLKLCMSLLLLFTTLLYGVYFHFGFTNKEISAQGKYVTWSIIMQLLRSLKSGFYEMFYTLDLFLSLQFCSLMFCHHF